MDALPLIKKAGYPYCSKVNGAMHAGGHDVHVEGGLKGKSVLFRRPYTPRLYGTFHPRYNGETIRMALT